MYFPHWLLLTTRLRNVNLHYLVQSKLKMNFEETLNVISGLTSFFTPLCTQNFIKFLTSVIFSLTCNFLILFLVLLVYFMLYSFFWVTPRRLNFMRRRFGTLAVRSSYVVLTRRNSLFYGTITICCTTTCSTSKGFVTYHGSLECEINYIYNYMVVNVLEDRSASISTGRQKMEAVCPDQDICTHQLDYMVP